MFDIENDHLFLEGRPVAALLSLSRAARRNLDDVILDYTSPDDMETDHAKEMEAALDEAFEEGRKDEREEWKNRIDDEREKIEAKGFEDGHAQGILDAGKASDAARVQILLLALQEMHNLIQPLWQGVEESGSYKRRTAQVGETKRAAQSACSAAHRALNAYRADE